MSVLSNALSNTRQVACEYYNQLPVDTKSATAQSFAVGWFVISVLTLNPYTGLVAGALSATASLVHSLSAPIFKQIFEKDDLNFVEATGRTFVALLATHVIGAFVGRGYYSLGDMVIGSLFWTFVHGEDNLRNARIFIF